jgi:LPXTG-motif cell wall-anchored protein
VPSLCCEVEVTVLACTISGGSTEAQASSANSWFPDSTTAEAADWNGVGATVLAEGQAIAAGETQHFAITIHARVAAGVTGTSAADCTLDDSETGTGFLNRAILTASGASATKSDCSQPVSPSFTKELDGALLPGLDDNEYVVSYTLTAKNDTALDLYYDLSDTLGFASGVIVTSASVTGPDGLVAGWDGSATTLITSGRPLAAGHTEVWTVTVGLLVTAQVDEADLACSPTEGAGHGLFNGAVLSSGSDRFPDSACAPVLPQLPTLPFDPPTLAYTGAQPSGWLLAGLALLGGGLLLVAFRTRRTGRHVA